MATEVIVERSKEDKIVAIAVKQLHTSEEFKQPRMKEIHENEDMVAGVVKPALAGRYNVPFDSVIGSGFVETLVAQVNKSPRLDFVDPKGSNAQSVKKVQALWEFDSSTTRQNWAKQDRLSKRLAAVANIGIFEYYAEKGKEGYKGNLCVIDHYDFHCEPNGGADLETHLFKGVYNQFQTVDEVKRLGDSGYYKKAQVNSLLRAYSDKDYKMNEDMHRNKIDRMSAMSLDIDQHSYVGVSVLNLARWVTQYEGEDYYLVFDYNSGIWLKCDPLKNVFGLNQSPWVVWTPVEHAFNLWAPGLFDQIKPVAEAIRINLNEILNNNRKRNWDMRAVDQKMFPDVSKLNWRQDGVVAANVPMGQSITNGIYHFQTPEISGALNLNQYLNDFLGINTGISDQTKGESSQDTLGIARINELQVSKRMKLIGDSYTDAYAEIGLRWDWGLYEHIDNKQAVKVIGPNGAEMETVLKDDCEPDYDIRVITALDDVIDTERDRERKASAMERLANNPLAIQLLNPKWYIEQELLVGGWSQEDVKRAMDTKNDATDEVISAAEKNIERILQGKEPKRARNATTGYLQRILNFMADNENLKPKQLDALQKHFDEHVQIADENKARQAQGVAGQNPTDQAPDGGMMGLPTNPMQNGNPIQTNPAQGQVSGPLGQAPLGGMGAGGQPPVAGF
jgi:hypothetical protein